MRPGELLKHLMKAFPPVAALWFRLKRRIQLEKIPAAGAVALITFLMLGAAPHLDGKYSAFGRVVSGEEVLDAFDKEAVNGESPKRRIELIQATIDQ